MESHVVYVIPMSAIVWRPFNNANLLKKALQFSPHMLLEVFFLQR